MSLRDVLSGTSRDIKVPAADGKMKTVTVKVPRGVQPGMNMQLTGQGLPAREPGLAPGNVIVTFQIREDPRFVRDGGNLIHEAQIGIEVAALGGQVTVPTLEGDVNVKARARAARGRHIARDESLCWPALVFAGVCSPASRVPLFLLLPSARAAPILAAFSAAQLSCCNIQNKRVVA